MPIRNDVIDQLVSQLSPEGREVWGAFEHLAEDVPKGQTRTPAGEMTPEHRGALTALAERSVRLSARDQEIWERLSAAKKRAFDDRIRTSERQIR